MVPGGAPFTMRSRGIRGYSWQIAGLEGIPSCVPTNPLADGRDCRSEHFDSGATTVQASFAHERRGNRCIDLALHLTILAAASTQSNC